MKVYVSGGLPTLPFSPTYLRTESDVSGVSAIAIALGGYHTCAIESGGLLKCWGNNGFGQLGIGSNTNQASPVTVPGERLCFFF